MKITVNESQASAYKVADDLAEEVRIELKDLLLDESDVEDAFKDVAAPILKDVFGGKREYANVQLWPSDDPDDGLLYTIHLFVTDGDKHKLFATGELYGEYDGDDGLFRINRVILDPEQWVDSEIN